MKLRYFLLTALGLTCTFSMAQKKECLSSTSVNSDFTEYTYRPDGQVLTRTVSSTVAATVCDSLDYNDKGQNIRKTAYQFYNDQPYVVNKAEYTYNAEGLLATRDNYNTYNGPMEHSAHIVYEYNNKGQKVKETQFWARDLDNPFAYMNYSYNSQGNLSMVEQYKPDNWDETKFVLTDKVVYTYNAQGQLLKSQSFYSDSFGTYASGSNEYEYDENGNLATLSVLDYSGKVTTKTYYTYDLTALAEEIVYPKTNEYDVLNGHATINKLLTESLYEVRNDEETLTSFSSHDYVPFEGTDNPDNPEPQEQSFDFNYGTTANGYIGTQAAEKYDCAIYIPADYAGKHINTVSFPLWQKAILKNVSAWVSATLPTNITQAEAYMPIADADLLNFLDGMNTVTLPNSYTIPEGGCYIGYSFEVTSAATDYGKWPVLLFIDRADKGAFYMRTSKALPSWDDYSGVFADGGWYGNLLLSANISGTFDDNAVYVSTTYADAFGAVDSTAPADVTLTNKGVTPLKTVTYIVEYEGKDNPTEITYELPTPLDFEVPTNVSLPIPTASTTGTANATITITKANGTNNNVSQNTASGTVTAVSRLAPRRVLEEEFTGNTCGYCPRGITGMEECQKQLGDSWCGVALHLYQQGDPMWPTYYIQSSPYYDQSQSIIDMRSYFTGAPQCMLNRVEKPDPYYGSINNSVLGILDDCKRLAAKAPIVDLNVYAKWANDDKDQITIQSNVEFLLNSDNHYALAYYIIGDDIYGPSWKQSNYFSGSTAYADEPYLSKWYAMDKTVVGLHFNHVALAGFGLTKGLEGSISGNITEGEVKSHIMDIDLAGCKFFGTIPEKDFLQKENVSVIAFVLNTDTGEVMNAAQCSIGTSIPGGISQLTENNAIVGTYDIQGRRISDNANGLKIKRMASGKVIKTTK